MYLNHRIPKPPPYPSLWKNYLPQNWSLMPKRLGTAALWEKGGVAKKGFHGHVDCNQSPFLAGTSN